jgi:putative nucleotidyltransferase with HDIG domain
MSNNNSAVNYQKRSYLEDLQSIRNLPSLPLVVMEVQNLLDNPMTNASELAETISKDQGMVAKVLTVANSTLYGLPRRVSTIEFAIVILGLENIKNIIVALSMFEVLNSKADKYWDRRKYWAHSLTTAVIAKRIADELGYSKSGEAFTAGLLHDLGISIIQRYFNSEFIAINKIVDEKQIPYLEAEKYVMEITHQEIGYFLGDKWNLPKSLNEVILNHHNPCNTGENKILTSIIHLADYMTGMFEVGNFKWDRDIQLDCSIIEILKLGNEHYLNEFMESYRDIFNNNLETVSR